MKHRLNSHCPSEHCRSEEWSDSNAVGSIDIKISGLACPDCAKTLEKAIKKIEGLEKSSIDFTRSSIVCPVINPRKIEEIKKLAADFGYEIDTRHIKTVTLNIPEMDCFEEVKMIRKKLENQPGIIHMEFYPVNREAAFLIDSRQTDGNRLSKMIKDLGMTSSLKSPVKNDSSRDSVSRRYLYIGVFSGILIIGAYLFSLSGYEHIPVILYLLAIMTGGFHISRRAFFSLKNREMDMNVLMTAAVIGAVFLKEWSEAAIVVFLFAIAQLLENRSLEKARNAIKGLMDKTPGRVIIIKDGETGEKNAEDVEPDEIMIIKPGEKIALDGVVLEGNSLINQAPITGESVPVFKEPGNTVFAGTINGSGGLKVRVTSIFSDTAISRMIKLVEEAQAKRAPAQAFVDRFARYYTPSVILIALAIVIIPTLFFHKDLHEMIYRALVLLLIACPCALVISTPVSVVSGLTNAAKSGVLIKGGIHLENLSEIDILASDKTGTLTNGRLSISAIVPLNGYSKEKILSIASGIESYSEHPISRSIIEYSNSQNVKPAVATNFQAITGKGASAEIDGIKWFAGNHRLFCDDNLHLPHDHQLLEELEQQGKTVVVIGNNQENIGIISLSDTIRKEALEMVRDVKNLGIKRILMLSGDNMKTAEAIAHELGISYEAQLLPEEKVKIIEELKKQGHKIAMLGDGVNDAPALAAAHEGIAMGAAGTDTALEVADIALMSDDLSRIPYIIRLSRKTLAIIKQNIVIAIGLKSAFLILGVLGMATLWMAVFADMGASLIVILNGLRLLRFK